MNKILYNMLIGYANAKKGELYWWEESWLDYSPEEIIQNFNSTLHPGERPRKLIDYEILEVYKNKPHTWRKSNLVTMIKGGQLYDTYRCEVCGVTGKRFSLGDSIILDKKHRKKGYCI